MYGYRLPDEGGTRVFFMGGAQVGLRTSCMEGTFNCNTAGLDREDFDWGVVLGGGVSLPAGTSNLVLDLRYLEGFHDVGSGKNRGVTIGVAYMIPHGQKE